MGGRWFEGQLEPHAEQGQVDAGASALLLPHPAVPGRRQVVQVAEWSSSVACWWPTGDDWRAHPGDPRLFAEFPLQPDGIAQAAAWPERELRRPVVTRSRSYGLARHRRWLVVADDGAKLVVRQHWLSARRSAGPLPGPGSWLLGAAVAAAVVRWLLAVLTPALLDAPWLSWAARLLDVAAFAALLAWFQLAAAERPARLRMPMRTGLLLATLAEAVELIPGPGELPSPADPPSTAVRLALHSSLPSLLGAAAVACFLVTFLRLPARTSDPPWPPILPAVAGLAWGLDGAVGLWWLTRFEPATPEESVLLWPSVLLSAVRVAAVALAIVLAFVLADRRPAMTRPGARAGLAGALLLVLTWSFTVQLGIGWLVPLPLPLGAAIVGVPGILAAFVGTALLALAAAVTPRET